MLTQSTEPKENQSKSFNLTTDADARAYSPAGVFERWLFDVLPSFETSIRLGAITDQTAESLCRSAERDNQAIRQALVSRLLLEHLLGERKEIVVTSQAMIGSTMDRLEELRSWDRGLEAVSQLLTELQDYFEVTLDFLHQTFPHYFNYQGPLPVICRKKFALRVEGDCLRLKEKFKPDEQADGSLMTELLIHLGERFATHQNPVTFTDVLQTKALLEVLQTLPKGDGTESLRQLLYELNFNEQWFVEKECELLIQQAALYDAPKQRIAVLKLQQKRMNQRFVRPWSVFNAAVPAVKAQLNVWIEEEVKFLEGGYATSIAMADGQPTDKIHTSLSVAKLAVIVRLLVQDKIIINRTVAPMLRIVAKTFATLQRDEISFGSLEAKYHAPDKASVQIVRDMLFKWINILGKL